jgi:hypothetical protein
MIQGALKGRKIGREEDGKDGDLRAACSCFSRIGFVH